MGFSNGKGSKKGTKGTKGVRHAPTDLKTKGAGKKGKKGSEEKRIDPSDGNGPFTLHSFIRFHGEQKGKQLWAQAVPGEPGQAVNRGSDWVPREPAPKGDGKKGKKGKAVAKGKGKGKGKKGSAPPNDVEKRIDPSDGNGPFSKASFIKFHGEEKGDQLWEEAGALLDLDPMGDDVGMFPTDP